MEQPIPWVQQLAEGRLEQLDELFLTLSTVLRRAVYEAIGRAFSSEALPPPAYEPRSDRYREAFSLDTDEGPDELEPDPDELARRRIQKHRNHAGLASLAGFMKSTRSSRR